ncbi:fibronectin type III domain-containing protein [bacterium]|nr:fibronectin type III domain-containing protein [bacterium]
MIRSLRDYLSSVLTVIFARPQSPAALLRTGADERVTGLGPSRFLGIALVLLVASGAVCLAGPEHLDDFQLIALTDPELACAATEGGNIISLGKDLEVRFVLLVGPMLEKTLPAPILFKGTLAGRELDFERISETEFVAKAETSSLKKLRDTKPVRIAIWFQDKARKAHNLRTDLSFVVDTQPPAAPDKLRVEEKAGSHFSLVWDPSPGDVGGGYTVQKWDAGQWRTVAQSAKYPRARVPVRPHGRFRVAARDCASNEAYSDELALDDTVLKFSHRACSRSKDGAFLSAEATIRDDFVRDACNVLLERDRSLRRSDVLDAVRQAMDAPDRPEIRITPMAEAQFEQQGGKWCVELTGKVDRVHFENWCKSIALN